MRVRDKFYEDELYKHNQEVSSISSILMNDLQIRIDEHDDSKFTKEEYHYFAKAIRELKATTYGTPEYKEALKGLGEGLEHHYKVNSHHPEYFGDVKQSLSKMTLIDFLEFFIDCWASTKRHEDGDIYKSIEIQAEKLDMPESIKQMLINTVDEYKGEL